MFSASDKSWTWFPSWTGWGITMMDKLNNYTSLINDVMEKNSQDIELLNDELKAIRKQLELHELAIESMSAALTGLCEMTQDYECCTWIHNTSLEIPDYYDVINQHRTQVNELMKQARDIGNYGWNPFSSLGLGGMFSWLKNIVIMIIVVLLLGLIGYLIFKLNLLCISKCTTPDQPSHAYTQYLHLYVNEYTKRRKNH